MEKNKSSTEGRRTVKAKKPSAVKVGSVPAKTPAQNIVVTLADNALKRFAEIRKQLEASGMVIETPLEGLGQCIGTSSASVLDRLAAIEGVAAVEQLGEVHLPPSPLDPQ